VIATFSDGAKCLCMMTACEINALFLKTFFFPTLGPKFH